MTATMIPAVDSDSETVQVTPPTTLPSPGSSPIILKEKVWSAPITEKQAKLVDVNRSGRLDELAAKKHFKKTPNYLKKAEEAEADSGDESSSGESGTDSEAERELAKKEKKVCLPGHKKSF